jgi:AmiR/NasT family two-component response regulator
MAQQSCTDAEAFGLLRHASQGRNIKVRDVAAQIVANVQHRKPGQPGDRHR